MKMNFSAVIRAALLVGFATAAVFADINISVDAKSGVKKISPFIFGRNIQGTYDIIADTNAVPHENEMAAINIINEAGVHLLRMNQGNNATKYNWRKHLSSHPDWINNVYDHNWDYTAKKVLDYMPGVSGLYGFQLTGYAASNKDHNFDEWNWFKNHQDVRNNEESYRRVLGYNLAGGGQITEDGYLIQEGSYENYLETWTSDSTVGILKYWRDELKYDMSRFQYWSMDNEPEIWAGGHDDLPKDFSTPKKVADAIIDSFIEVAVKARAIYPGIKITGPVVANEWLWCNVNYIDPADGVRKSSLVPDGSDDNKVCWLEYFVKRIAQAQKERGVRLLDVFDIHWYPTEKDYETLINLHRVFYDTTYNYPGTNSMHAVSGHWDWPEPVTKEYIFKRVNDWMNQYMGEGHGVTFGVTETEFLGADVMTNALIYASWLGTFADNGVEIFTPWVWKDGMYEVLHLFSRYGHANRVESISSNDSLVSAYSSFNGADSMTVIFVNRSAGNSQNVNLSIANFDAIPQAVPTYTLSGLSGETFVSHTSNALKKGTANIADNKLSITLPAKSIMAVQLTAPKVEESSSSAAVVEGSSSSEFLEESSSSTIPSSASEVKSSSSSVEMSSSAVHVESSSSVATGSISAEMMSSSTEVLQSSSTNFEESSSSIFVESSSSNYEERSYMDALTSSSEEFVESSSSDEALSSAQNMSSSTEVAMSSSDVFESSSAENISSSSEDYELSSSSEMREKIPQKLLKQEISIYRNGDFWFVDNSRGLIISVDVMSVLGQHVESMNALAVGQVRLATEGMTAGQYVVRLRTSAGFSTQKILLK